MVHKGPSRGCLTCRKRKIKCDEVEPACSYCVRKGVVCPGYRTLFEVAWRDQNKVAENRVRRQKNIVDKPTEKDSDTSPGTITTKSPTPTCVSQDFTSYAVQFFLSSYVLLPRSHDNRRSFIDFLYPIYLESKPASPLTPALTAVGSLLLEAWSLLKPDAPSSFSRTQYLKAMASLRRSLQDTKTVGDDVLTAALLLDMYESVRAFLWSKPVVEGAHINGVVAMIEQRRQYSDASAASKLLSLGARHHVIHRALHANEPMPESLSDCIELHEDVSRNTALRLDELDITLANIGAAASRVGRVDDIQEQALQILSKAYKLDQQYQSWADTAPSGWIVRVSGLGCIPPSVQRSGLYQDHCHVYQSIFVAHTFNTYRVSRIKLQEAIVVCLTHLGDNATNTATRAAYATIQLMADDICASVPYHLGDRMHFARIDDKVVEYPHLTEQSRTDDEHIAGAAAMGGWSLAAQLVKVLKLQAPLRDGQRQWIVGQLQRLVRIYSSPAM
ncbi:hypothetical protein MBLNU457_7532t1 [Dothideomycetes sp. NU457]